MFRLSHLTLQAKKKLPVNGSLGRGVFSGVVVSLMASLFLQFAPFTSNAADNSPFSVKNLDTIKQKLTNAEDSMEHLSSLYHQTVNDIVNAYMDGFTKNNSNNKANTAPPVGDPKTECAVVGSKMNLSTYCLFLRIDGLYSVYSATMQEKQNTVLQEIDDIQHGRNYQGDSANSYRVRQQWIVKELEASRSAMDSVLRSYSELLIQYPMHLEYQKTLKLLIKYYDQLVDVRKKTATYPARFQDVTTANCT